MAKADFCSKGFPGSGVVHFDKLLKLLRDAEQDAEQRTKSIRAESARPAGGPDLENKDNPPEPEAGASFQDRKGAPGGHKAGRQLYARVLNPSSSSG